MGDSGSGLLSHPAGGPDYEGHTRWGTLAPSGLFQFILSPPVEGWHLLPHFADEELRPRDPGMEVLLPGLTDPGADIPDQDFPASSSAEGPLLPVSGMFSLSRLYPSRSNIQSFSISHLLVSPLSIHPKEQRLEVHTDCALQPQTHRSNSKPSPSRMCPGAWEGVMVCSRYLGNVEGEGLALEPARKASWKGWALRQTWKR